MTVYDLNKNHFYVVPPQPKLWGINPLNFIQHQVQGMQGYFWSEREVNLKLRDIMEKAFENVYRMATKRKVSMRKAALMFAIERVADATKVRGLYP